MTSITIISQPAPTDAHGSSPAPSAIDALLTRARQRISVVDARTAAAMRRRGALLVDTRPVDQRKRFGQIPVAVVIDRTVLEWRLDPTSPYRHALVVDHQGPIIVFCQEGYSSGLAVATLAELGVPDVHELAGGFEAWAAAQFPVEPAPPERCRSTDGRRDPAPPRAPIAPVRAFVAFTDDANPLRLPRTPVARR